MLNIFLLILITREINKNNQFMSSKMQCKYQCQNIPHTIFVFVFVFGFSSIYNINHPEFDYVASSWLGLFVFETTTL